MNTSSSNAPWATCSLSHRPGSPCHTSSLCAASTCTLTHPCRQEHQVHRQPYAQARPLEPRVLGPCAVTLSPRLPFQFCFSHVLTGFPCVPPQRSPRCSFLIDFGIKHGVLLLLSHKKCDLHPLRAATTLCRTHPYCCINEVSYFLWAFLHKQHAMYLFFKHFLFASLHLGVRGSAHLLLMVSTGLSPEDRHLRETAPPA